MDVENNPGVQGLAQLGRNAIDELIERDKQISELAMLVCRMARRIRGPFPNDVLASSAMKYLKEIGYEHGVMRK